VEEEGKVERVGGLEGKGWRRERVVGEREGSPELLYSRDRAGDWPAACPTRVGTTTEPHDEPGEIGITNGRWSELFYFRETA
jgi:hypothetical protein